MEISLRIGGLITQSPGRYTMSLGYNRDLEGEEKTSLPVGEYNVVRPFSGSPEDFQKRVKDSIDKTESPHKRVVETNSVETQLANSSASFIQNLPPRV